MRFPNKRLKSVNGELVNPLSASRTAVIYFFPKAFTQGCTREAIRSNELVEEFEKRGAAVIGVLTDPPYTLKKFTEKLGLRFPLLRDEGGKLARGLGILRPTGTAERVTHVVRCGEVIKVIRGLRRVEDHADEALKVVRNLGDAECA